MRFLGRQGDVAFFALDDDESAQATTGADIPRDGKGRIVLAEGELTGHAHVVWSRAAQHRELTQEARERFAAHAAAVITLLSVAKRARALAEHEEHGMIPLPAGDILVVRQCEYSPAAIRPVRD